MTFEESNTKVTSDKVTKSVGAPTTMAELLAATKHKINTYKRGDVVKGRVAAVVGRTMFVDVGGKTEGILGDREFDMAREYLESLKVGDEVSGVVISQENDSGQIILSLKRAVDDSRRKSFEEARENGTNYRQGSRSQQIWSFGRCRRFGRFYPILSFSRELSESPSYSWANRSKVQVIEVDREQNRLVLSEKAVTEAVEIEERKKLLKLVKIGTSYDGTVTGIVPFGPLFR